MKVLNKPGERYVIPRRIQDMIPIRRIWADGITQVSDTTFSKTWRFTDINYLAASDEDQVSMFLGYSALLNSLDSGCTAKITINNRHLNRADFEQKVLLPARTDHLEEYCREYNQVLMDTAAGGSGIVQEKYITITAPKRDISAAKSYMLHMDTVLSSRFSAIGAQCSSLDATEKLRLLHDFYRPGEESFFRFDIREMMRRGHDFRDYICPDSIERYSDYMRIGEQFCRVLYLKEYGSFIRDDMVTKLTDVSRSLMLSIDIVPISMDAAIREAESRVLGVETNIANWQRKQNRNNNYSAAVPYDLELQRQEAREFLNDLMTRNQRMMLAEITIALLADSKEQLDNDTDAICSIGLESSCQFATLTFQQADGLNTALPIGGCRVNTWRTLNTESLAVFMPFKVQEIQEPGGIFVGVNAISRNLLLCNRERLLNQSTIITGVPGSGKSFFAKEFIISLILGTEDDILICDPEGEFVPLIEALGAESSSVIRMAAGGQDRLNAMYMVDGYGVDDPIAIKSQFIMSLLEQIDENNVNPRHKSIIDRCVAAVYQQAKEMGITPTLCTLRDKLLEQPEEEAADIALSLELYTTGTLDMFGRDSTVDLEKRIVVFDIHELSSHLKPAGLLMITDTMMNRVALNWKNGRRTHIFVDEFHVVYENRQSADFFHAAWKQWRKRGGYPTAITQNVDYLLDSLQARTMLSNSEFLVMFNQAPPDREKLAALLKISDKQMNYCTDVKRGCGLMKYGSALVPFINDFPENTKLYKLMTTKLGEGAFGGNTT